MSFARLRRAAPATLRCWRARRRWSPARTRSSAATGAITTGRARVLSSRGGRPALLPGPAGARQPLRLGVQSRPDHVHREPARRRLPAADPPLRARSGTRLRGEPAVAAQSGGQSVAGEVARGGHRDGALRDQQHRRHRRALGSGDALVVDRGDPGGLRPGLRRLGLEDLDLSRAPDLRAEHAPRRDRPDSGHLSRPGDLPLPGELRARVERAGRLDPRLRALRREQLRPLRRRAHRLDPESRRRGRRRRASADGERRRHRSGADARAGLPRAAGPGVLAAPAHRAASRFPRPAESFPIPSGSSREARRSSSWRRASARTGWARRRSHWPRWRTSAASRWCS